MVISFIMGKLMIMTPLLLLLITKVCHAEISNNDQKNEQKPIYVTTEGQGPFVLSQYSSDSTPSNVVEYVRNRPTPRIEHEFNIPNENGFNVLDIADGHGTKIVYIKNTPPSNKVQQPMVEVFEEQSVPSGVNANYARKEINNKNGLRKDSFQSVSTYQGVGDAPQALQFQFPFGSFSVPIPILLGMPTATVGQRFPGSNVMRDPENRPNSPLYGPGPGFGGGYPPYGGNYGGGGGGYYPGPGYYPNQGFYPGGGGGYPYPIGGPGDGFGGYPGGGYYPGGNQGYYPGPGGQGFYPGGGYPHQGYPGGQGHYGIGPQGQLGGPGGRPPYGGPFSPPIFGSPAKPGDNVKPPSDKGQEEFDDRSTLHKTDKTQSKPIFIKPHKPVVVTSAPIKTKPINKEPTTDSMSEQLTDLTDKKDETTTAKLN